ncbi:NUDIX domain-containing protein [Massilia atriviolacea]|uniref:NUDIX domain-containing protein n=1 Tax=Massilia atriviolacea TaxID=2495579 RepID=A0A430HFX3_9BURK|nr:NUDIX domain-containing protein [Massilia atriviolacea]RSZ56413.1 NUDIX domain-containing protein [Massilia atriviolacea]
MQQSIIVKCAAAIVREKSLLLTRKQGTTTFISPGGKPLPGEAYLDCLAREVREELDVAIQAPSFLGIFYGVSAFEDTPIHMHVYLTDIVGTPRASMEIEEIMWYRPGLGKPGLTIGSVFANAVIPLLIKEKLIG